MHFRVCWLLISVLALTVMGQAADLRMSLFARTPAAAAGELVTPRVIVANPASSRIYVLDSGAERVAAFTVDGEQVGEWTFASLGLQLPLAVDPMLPIPALAVGGGGVYVLNADRAARKVEISVLEGAGSSRTVTLPDAATNGALTIDGSGRLLVAFLEVRGRTAVLSVAREEPTGEMSEIASLENPCDVQTANLVLTGIACAPDGRFAVGIAQSGSTTYSFVRSWLVQGTYKNGAMSEELRGTHQYALVDGQERVLERFRAAVTMAGRNGYPARPCVPLFTALTLATGGTVISGGHTVDPFLRVYEKDGSILRSVPHKAVGGQSIAMLSQRNRVRLFAISPELRRINELTMDGRVVGGFGAVAPYDLSHPVALAADGENLYVVSRVNTQYQLMRFSSTGAFRWAQMLTTPTGMGQGIPSLAVTSGARVLIGWRLPKVAGVGWVDTVMEDGAPGLPLWKEPYTKASAVTGQPLPAPIMTGQNGKIYVLCETKDGPRVRYYSSVGAELFTFPVAVQGVTFVGSAGNLAWARPDNDGMILAAYTSVGVAQGWKRVPRQAHDAQLLPVHAGTLWGWLTSTNSLLRFDERFIVIDEVSMIGPDGNALRAVSTITGDGVGKVYVALPDRIYCAPVGQE